MTERVEELLGKPPPDPDAVLALSELQPLIRNAAKPHWERGDYAQAVRAGWFALRDLLRDKLSEPGLDGVDLVNAIGETADPPRLPMTDCVTETEKNIHRGVVNLLRGVVFYIRNPQAHETESPVTNHRIGAFECLALMSTCARFAASAARPTAVEDALVELAQPHFPRAMPR
jgi:uncharacterized protein (TIGR02391 family)